MEVSIMGRSVSYATGATTVAYTTIEDDEFALEDLKEYVTSMSMEMWPSLYQNEEWIGNEDLALVENSHCKIGVSEYCGLVSIWIVPREWDGYGVDTTGIAEAWCSKIADRFLDTFGDYVKVGTFSNGEGIYERKRI